MFKQLLQADAIDVLQIDATRVGGVNENIAILLLAAKFGVPVCPHAGGVGLCETGAAPVDVRLRRGVRARTDGPVIEYVDHLHEHFVTPVDVARRPLLAADRPGSGRRDARRLPRRLRLPGRPGLGRGRHRDGPDAVRVA